ELGNALKKRFVRLNQLVDLRQQRQHQPLQAFGVERIELLRWHPEGESDRPAALNASLVSHTDAGVSNYTQNYMVDSCANLNVAVSLELFDESAPETRGECAIPQTVMTCTLISEGFRSVRLPGPAYVASPTCASASRACVA